MARRLRLVYAAAAVGSARAARGGLRQQRWQLELIVNFSTVRLGGGHGRARAADSAGQDPEIDHRDRQHAAVPAVRRLADRLPEALHAQRRDPTVTITTGGTGSGTGITDASTGTVNIGASDAYLSSAQTVAVRRA